MRLDRTISLHLVAPLQGNGAAQGRLPILMYHSISDDAEPGVHPYFRVATSPQRFAEHLDVLRQHGWKGVSLEEGISELAAATRAQPKKQVAITFDDGFRDFHSTAWPLLKDRGFTATMFLATDFIGSEHRLFKSRPCMTWREISECRRSGIRFGSHTASHPSLPTLGWDGIERELEASKQAIERELGEPVVSFAHPYAFPIERRGYSERFKVLLGRAGYRISVTTMVGRATCASDLLCLPRLPVNQEDDAALLLGKINGHYDWMCFPQRFLKHRKGWLRMLTLSRGSHRTLVS